MRWDFAHHYWEMERKTFVVNDIFESIKNVVGIKLKWRKLSSYVEDESFSLPPQYVLLGVMDTK